VTEIFESPQNTKIWVFFGSVVTLACIFFHFLYLLLMFPKNQPYRLDLVRLLEIVKYHCKDEHLLLHFFHQLKKKFSKCNTVLFLRKKPKFLHNKLPLQQSVIFPHKEKEKPFFVKNTIV
jgi:hypothetical protein